jgi:hypothetical protein
VRHYIAKSGKSPDSYESLVKYVQTVLEQRTYVPDDTTENKLARGIVLSILHRLDIDWPGSYG